MKRKLMGKNSIAFIIVLVLAVVLAYRYSAYSNKSRVLEQKHIKEIISPIYNYQVDTFMELYRASGNDLDAALKNYHIDYPIDGVEYILVNNMFTLKGIVLYCDSDSVFFTKSNILDYLNDKEFRASYPFHEFNTAYNNNHEAIGCFTEPTTGKERYIYYIPGDYPVDFIMVADAELIEGEVMKLVDDSKNFLAAQVIIAILFVIWVIFAHVYNTLNLNKVRLLLDGAQRRYKTALMGKNNYIWEYYPDTDDMIWDEANPVKKVLLDVSGKARKQMITSGQVHPDDQWTFYHFCDDLISMDPYVTAEFRIKNPEDEYHWYQISGTKVFGDESYPVSVIGQTMDIHTAKLENEALREQASQDPVTKLYNYKTFSELATNKIQRNEDAEIMAFMIINLDNFNAINESFGYIFADAVLVDIAGRLKKIFPDSALLSRYGGDEFVALVGEVPSMSFVIDLAQNVLASVRNTITNSKSGYRLTCSIGISLFPVDDNNYDRLFEKADIALCDAKTHGKGRYSIYNASMPQLSESTRIKNSKKLEANENPTEHSIVDTSILVNAIDILFDSKDLKFSIDMMLSLVGIYYNLEHLTVVVYDINDNFATVSHEWVAEDFEHIPEVVKMTPTKRDRLFTAFESRSNSCYVCDDIKELPNQELMENEPYLKNTSALIQYGIKYHNEYIGYINFGTTKARNWAKSEIDSIELLSKLIGSYIIQLRSQETLEYVSQIDSLTGVFNFNTFLTKTGQLLASDRETKYAFIYADLLQFKLINDNFGYASGDAILIEIADILKAVGGSNSLIGRVTGDRFIALYPYDDEFDLVDKIKKVTYMSKHISQPNGDYYKLTLMSGLYCAEPGDSSIVAIDRANIARKNIIDYHNCSYMFYNESMHEDLLEQKEIEDTMEEALQNNEFVVYYQPKIKLETHELIGAEALVRWVKQGNVIPPLRFIPIFEENGFIVQLDYYVLEKVCESIRQQLDAGIEVKPVSVNFSRAHLNNTALPTMIEVTLSRYNIPAELIEVEITESALNASNMYQFRILNDIHQIGCRLSMDDFGSGMSSLNLLRELPFDVLKIDKDFLHNKVMTKREQVVIKNVVRMAHELDMDVICEGVETEEQELFLKNIGCTNGQGYLYSKPIPEEEYFEKFLNK